MNTIKISQQFQIEHWQDLLPSQTQTESNCEDPFAELTLEQLEDLAILSRIRWLIASNKADPKGASAEEAKQIEEAFVKEGIDVDWLLSKRQTIRQNRMEQATNKSIDGKDIKLSGVILPLYWNEKQLLTHFLLMPYLGQCSHFPPPPPNQVIYVKCSQPFDIQKLTANRKKSEYSFLWVSVEGTISLEVTSHNVFRVDGMSWLESSYGVICHKISLCTPRDIAQVLAWQAREERKSLYPKLTELISIDDNSHQLIEQMRTFIGTAIILVIFIGVFGGTLAHRIIGLQDYANGEDKHYLQGEGGHCPPYIQRRSVTPGLFIGPVVLGFGYELLGTWINDDTSSLPVSNEETVQIKQEE